MCMKKITTKSRLVFLALFLLGACNIQQTRNQGSDSSQEKEEALPLDGSHIQGHYQAKFMTMNPHVNGTIPGSANFFRKEERIYAFVRLFAGGVKAWHMQNVYTGSRCPVLSDDKNADGFIDIQEAEEVLGKILIPLDSDISNQQSGKRFFPVADLSGNYQYERVGPFRRFIEDLQREDKDPEDDFVKIPRGQGLRLIGKTVLVQGVSETLELPETLATKGRHRSFQTLPVACGVFEKVERTPGTPYILDNIPGPVAEVVDDQDRPSEEDEDEEEEEVGNENENEENPLPEDGNA
jgi:hypothetical protein